MTCPQHIVAISSAGGHWVQLMRLRPAWEGLDVTYVTTDPGLEVPLRAEAVGRVSRFFAITEANRWQKARLVKQLAQLVLVFLLTRPDLVITTGAAPGYFAIRLGRIFGARTIWIDSIANAEELSLSGQRAGVHADLWLTQWEHLAGPDGPRFLGAVL